MRMKNVTIVRAYYFMAEALIILLLVIPFLNVPEIPYWSYAGVAAGICTLFSIYAIKSYTNAWFISSVPLLVVFFYFAGFNVFFSILFACLCTWRFINICHNSILKRESTYILIALLSSIVLVVWFQNMMPVVYFVLILFITVTGNICSHIIVLEQNEQQGITHKFILYVSIALGLGVIWVILLFKIEFLFRLLSVLFIDSILWAMETLSKVAAYFFPKIHGGYREEVLEKANALYDYLVGNKQHPPTGEYIISWLSILGILIFIGFIIYFTFRHFRRRLLKIKRNKTNAAMLYKKIEKTRIGKKGWMHNLFNPFGKGPDHQVRKLVYQFEQHAFKVSLGRLPYETLGNWFERIEAPINPEVYEKIRYGKKIVSKEEVESLRENIKAIVNQWDKVNDTKRKEGSM